MAGRLVLSNVSRSRLRSADSPSEFLTVRLSTLRAGATLHHPILDERNVLLLAAGSRLTPSVLQILAHRGVQVVKVHRSELQECTGGSSAAPVPSYDHAIAKERFQRMLKHSSARDDHESQTPRFDPQRQGEFQNSIERHGDDRYDAALTEQFLETFEESKTQVDNLFSTLKEIGRTEMEQFAGITEASLRQLGGDTDLFLALGVSPDSKIYPAQHSLQTSMLALAIGSRFGLDKRNLVQLGIGCLAHDAGMMEVDQELIASKSPLDPMRFLEITRHPTATFDKMCNVQQLAGASRLVAYQMHERMNGSGYPRQRRGFQIHTLSRIASVADVFVALISPRPHRPGMIPYYAVEHLLRSTQSGEFDSQVVRALLETVSLFPIGSYVELSDGRIGRVIRTNGKAFNRPTVEVWNRSCLNVDPEVLNLSQRQDLAVVRPLRSLQRSPATELVDAWE